MTVPFIVDVLTANAATDRLATFSSSLDRLHGHWNTVWESPPICLSIQSV